MMNFQKLISIKFGIINLLFIYIFWSSTFLAIRIIVSGEYGISPFIMNGIRMLSAGVLLLLVGCVLNLRILPTKMDVHICIMSAIFIWGGGTALLTWGLRYVNSGVAAVITALIPLMVVFINILLGRKKVSLYIFLVLICGLMGLVTIVFESIDIYNLQANASIISIIVSSIFCAIGFVAQSSRKSVLPNIILSAYQLIISGLIFIVISIIFSENINFYVIPFQIVLLWIYLIVVTAIGVIAFLNIINLLPLDICMTYAYVNPVLALFWGVVFLNEKISSYIILGTIMIILSVVGVFKENIKKEINK